MPLTDDIWVTAAGTRCRIVTDGRTASRLRALLTDLLCPEPEEPPAVTFELEQDADGRIHHLRCRELAICEHGTIQPLLGRLVSNLAAAAVARFPGLAVHAGAVAANGRAVAFAAPSGVGKSTLTASCLLAGFDYVSDEALCLVPGDGATATPLAKPLALTGISAALLDLPRRRWHTKDLIPCSALGATAVTAPVEVDHIVVLSRTDRGTSVLQPRPASLAVSTLLAMAFNAYADPVTSVAIASSAARSTRCWELDVGDPTDAARALRELVARPRADRVPTSRSMAAM